ncbi:hypothetical protein BCR43DRAFT_565208 [Syncephalastrum racemosum]|uniref:Alpha/Beta hydrolase protein n=1 Tax=Syncephalastrum racemosum TaxID=13706 RepID=A0A1X2H8W9_SYNRA|nr:hypothetical protein BCR43DRAFT_565208 [Syncephalastrum racemosum]
MLGQFATPLRAALKVANTQAVWWPAKKEPKTLLLFIPGNPGLVDYYTEFLEEIYQSSDPHLEIYGVSHLGHAPPQDKLYSLQDQIDHKLDCLDALHAEHHESVILMGHSIGSYIAAEVLKHRPQYNITRLLALFPTLREIALTPNGVSISRMLKYIPAWALAGAASALNYTITAPLRQRLICRLTGQSPFAAGVTANAFLQGQTIRNVINMAQHEMESVRELDFDFYHAHVDKFVLYYSRSDQWTQDHYEFMKKKFPHHEHVYLCEQDLPHAFILNPEHASYMAQKVAEWIRNEPEHASNMAQKMAEWIRNV